MENKYKIGDKVIVTGRKAIIAATKKTPYKPSFDVYNRSEIYPINDYLIFYFEKIENDLEKYLGTNDIFESQIEKLDW
jgi:hypothetical protein